MKCTTNWTMPLPTVLRSPLNVQKEKLEEDNPTTWYLIDKEQY